MNVLYINEKLFSIVLCLVEQVKQHNYFKYQMNCQIYDLDQKVTGECPEKKNCIILARSKQIK